MIVNPGVRRNLGGGVSRAKSSAGFIAPLTSSLILSRGTGTLTDTRAGATATVIDFEGNVKTVPANCARFTGARFVWNNLGSLPSQGNFNAWNAYGTKTVTDNIAIAPDGTNTASLLASPAGNGIRSNSVLVKANTTWRGSIFAKPQTTGAIFIETTFNGGAGSSSAATITLPVGVWTRISVIATAGAGDTGIQIGFRADGSGNPIYIWGAQGEDVTNQSNQAPAPYVPSTEMSAGAAGCKYFEYLNGNTVTNNVVTEAQGAPIPAATLKGYLPEPAATNYFLNSGAPATQTTGSLGVGTYCCWVQGAGNIAIAGGTATITGAGSATAATPLVFNVTVAGTVVCTYTATLTFVQLENNPFPTSRIDTAGATVPRNADPLTEPTASNILAASGTLYGEFTPNHAPLAATSLYLFGTYVDANNSTAVLHDGTNLIFRKRIGGVNYDATIALAYVSGTTYKWAASWGASGTTIVLNGVAGTPHANTTAAQIAATMQEGADGNGAGQPTMNLRNRRIWPTQLPVATQQALTI